jgi:hypothetical protein
LFLKNADVVFEETLDGLPMFAIPLTREPRLAYCVYRLRDSKTVRWL